MTAEQSDPKPADAEQRICCPPDLQLHPLGEGWLVAHNRLSGGALVLDATAHQVLSTCRQPATLRAHAERLAQQGMPRAQIEQQLSAWRQAGLLIDVQSALPMPRPVTEPIAPPAALCIPTAGRPQLLARALRTLCKGAPAGAVCVVGDDSRDADMRRRTREQLASLKGELPVQVVLLDRQVRARMVEQLSAQTGVAPRLLRYALQPEPGPFKTYGANRNALLLALAGRPFVFADDDTFGPLQLPLAAADGLRLSSDPAQLQSAFPEPGETRFAHTHPCETSLLSAHAQLLGQPPATWLAGSVDPGGASTRLLARLGRPGARVAITQLGSMGDAGTGSLGHYLLQTGASRQRLLQSEEVYEWAHQSRLVQVFTEQPWVTDFSRSMGMACGLDASQLLPPFPPLLRNSDGVFGLMLSRCDPTALHGWLPAMVQHQPPEPRTTSFEETLAEMRGIDANDALARLVASAVGVEAPAGLAGNLHHLGERLCAFAAEPLPAFEARLRSIALRTRASDVQQLRRLLLQWDYEPSFWAQDVRRAIMTLEQAMIEPGLCWPRDMMAALGVEAGRAALRDHVAQLGELLLVWPQLFEAAQQLWPEPTNLISD